MKTINTTIIRFAVVLLSFAVSCTSEPTQPKVAVTGVTLSPESIEMEIGGQRPLTATISPSDATNKNVLFSSSKESVATVSQSGIVEAITTGKAIVTVTTEDGNYKAHCTVNVVEKIVHVTGVALNKTNLSMKEGDEFTLIPTVTPDNAVNKSVSWASDNDAIVTVSTEGIVKALKVGKATVTATTVDQNKTASCSIVVEEAIGAITGTASHVSCRNAEISGKANLPGTTSTDLSFGVLYSTSSGVLIGSATQIEATSFDSNYNYTVNTEVLEPETTYYYRSYMLQNKEISYGSVKSFKTLSISSMIQTMDATEINPKDAVLNASLDLTDCKYRGIEYGFEINTESGSRSNIKSSNHSEKKFSAKVQSLTIDTKYSAVAYVKIDGRTYKGETKNFTTTSVQASITAETSEVSCYSATISGKLAVESAGTFTKSAVLYYSSTSSTLETLISSGTKKTLTLRSDGSYSINLESLASNAQYKYVVIAKVDEIELNTGVKSFQTAQIAASVTAESSYVSYFSATISGKLTVESAGTFTKSAELYYSSTARTMESLKSSGTKKTLTLESDGSYEINLLSFDYNTQYNYVVVAKINDAEINAGVKTLKTLEGVPELVDLGLSVKWRGWNLGASKPEEYGGYYQWAGLKDVTSTSIYLDWSNCPYHQGSDEDSGWTKYIDEPNFGPVDNRSTLSYTDDVARVTLGGKWRMPTSSEMHDLWYKCEHEMAIVKGIKGMVFRSKKNGNSIFLPFAGYRTEDKRKYAGTHGFYWSSSLGSWPCYAESLYFREDSGNYAIYDSGRADGLSVRPVSK